MLSGIKVIEKQEAYTTIITKPSTVTTNIKNTVNWPNITSATHLETPINPLALSKLLGDKKNEIQTILNDFAAQVEEIVAEINNAFKEKNTDQIIFSSHKLQSSARLVGAENLADLCLALEKSARNDDWPVMNNLCTELQTAMEQVVKHINQ